MMKYPVALFSFGFFMIICSLYPSLPSMQAYVFSLSSVSLGFGAIVCSALSPRFYLAEAKSQIFSWISRLSFTLYLTHKLMLHAAKTLVGDYMTKPVATIILATVLMCLMALFVHYLIEVPVLNSEISFSTGQSRR